ncbi:unnamed protein product [Symbiodinium pilosum]|uniref:Uncharacterized protein n=1 Tax=Symbiodinium pilosum TaxID=2952 RepID=A0A812JP19_SYMPI|nr:unnamed protein product [Symbiodinium pilosum]
MVDGSSTGERDRAGSAWQKGARAGVDTRRADEPPSSAANTTVHPGATNVDEYVKRLQFLKELWPEEHLSLLGPRAALLAEGAAFQKVSRIAPDKSPDGVKILAEQLGGTWGRLQVEDKFHYFEQAIYQTQQKHDETNDSYIARHDAQFEELLSRKVQLEETRAYILLRHSQLAPEDKKRVIVESKGDLKYAETIKAIKLLGSHFFGERQNRNGSSAGTSRGQERNKVYDVNMTEADDSEEINMATYDEEVDEDEAFAYFFEQCDQDALYIAEFEDEARARFREKARSRGFWPVGKGSGKQSRGKSYGKKGGGFGKGKRPRTLAERISTSTRRLRGAVGHWKRECPKNLDNQSGNHKVEVSHLATLDGKNEEDSDDSAPEFLQDLPEDAIMYMDELSISDSQAADLSISGDQTIDT